MKKSTISALLLFIFASFILVLQFFDERKVLLTFAFGNMHLATVKGAPNDYTEFGSRNIKYTFYRFTTYENKFQIMSPKSDLRDGDKVSCIKGYHEFCLVLDSGTDVYSRFDYIKSSGNIAFSLVLFVLAIATFPFRHRIYQSE